MSLCSKSFPMVDLSDSPLQPLLHIPYSRPAQVDDSLWLTSLSLSAASLCDDEFREVCELVYTHVNPRKCKVEYQRHIELLVLGLARAAAFNKWLAVSLDSTLYGPAGASRNLEAAFAIQRSSLSYHMVKRLVDVFEELGLVFKLRGFHGRSGKGKSACTRLFPSPDFYNVVLPFALYTECPIEPPYVAVNGASVGWKEAIGENPEDERMLTFINDFLKDHSWACKESIRRVYTEDAFTGGRLYTAFQGLPSRKAKVRINTLIDGDPIAEVDFGASQLRLLAAMEDGTDLGEDPYGDLVSQTGLSREQVKSFVTTSLGAADEAKGRSALYSSRLTNVDIDNLVRAADDLWPSISGSWFRGLGVNLQYMEGNILLVVLYKGAQEEIVVLPIHDAVAVQQKHAEWAEETMNEVWNRMARTSHITKWEARPRLKVETPYLTA